MTRDQALAALDKVKAAMHEQFPESQTRLDQLDSHLATVGMVIDDLHVEAERK